MAYFLNGINLDSNQHCAFCSKVCIFREMSITYLDTNGNQTSNNTGTLTYLCEWCIQYPNKNTALAAQTNEMIAIMDLCLDWLEDSSAYNGIL